MRQFEHRAHIVTVSLSRHADKVEVITQILLPKEIDARVAEGLLAADMAAVSAAAADDIEHEACEAARRMIDVLIAERAVLARRR